MVLKRTIVSLLCLVSLSLSCTVWAGEHKVKKKDFERAYTLLEQGEILSLSEIIERTSERFPGKILEIELEEKDDVIIYEIEFLGEGGVVMKMYIHAKTGEILSVKED